MFPKQLSLLLIAIVLISKCTIFCVTYCLCNREEDHKSESDDEDLEIKEFINNLRSKSDVLLLHTFDIDL